MGTIEACADPAGPWIPALSNTLYTDGRLQVHTSHLHAAPDGTGMIIPCHQTFDSRLQGFGEFEPIRAKNLYSIVFEGIMEAEIMIPQRSPAPSSRRPLPELERFQPRLHRVRSR